MPYASGRFHRAQIALGREEEMLVSQFTKERFGTASAVAASLECRFGTSYAASDIVMAAGADSGINAFMDAVLKPEDEVIAFAPCGQTYRAIVEDRGARLVEVPLDEETMLPDFVALECMLTPRTKLAIVSMPNDPSAMAYPEAIADGIAGALFRAQRAFGHSIMLLSDEAHSDMANDEAQNPWWPAFYRNSAVVRTSDVSASVAGESVGYVALTPEMAGRGDVVAGIRTPQQITIEGSKRWAVAQKVSEEERKAKFPSLEEVMPEVYKELDEIQHHLEQYFKDMQDIEFTIQDGKLWMLQCRNGKRTGAAMHYTLIYDSFLPL